jgi:hypothetical protein
MNDILKYVFVVDSCINLYTQNYVGFCKNETTLNPSVVNIYVSVCDIVILFHMYSIISIIKGALQR